MRGTSSRGGLSGNDFSSQAPFAPKRKRAKQDCAWGRRAGMRGKMTLFHWFVMFGYKQFLKATYHRSAKC